MVTHRSVGSRMVSVVPLGPPDHRVDCAGSPGRVDQDTGVIVCGLRSGLVGDRVRDQPLPGSTLEPDGPGERMFWFLRVKSSRGSDEAPSGSLSRPTRELSRPGSPGLNARHQAREARIQ